MDKEVDKGVKERWEERIGPGWVHLRLTVTENLTLSTAGQHGTHLASVFLPPHLHSLHLTASNLTTDCHTGRVVWRVEGDWVSVPLAEERQGGGDGGTSYHHPFLLYSRHEVLPSLTIPGSLNILTLAWDPINAHINATTASSNPLTRVESEVTPFEGSTTGLEGSSGVTALPPASLLQPLPPLTPYRMRLACRDEGDEDGEEEGVLCEVREDTEEGKEEGGRLLGTLHAPSTPLVLRVRGEGPETLFLQQDTTPSEHPSAASLSPLHPTLSSPPPPPPSLTNPPKPEPDPSQDTLQPPTTPTPAPDGSGGGGSSGHRSGTSAGWSGWWVILTALLAFLLVFAIIMCFVSHYHRPKLEKYLEGLHLIPEGSSLEDLLDLPQQQQERRPLMLRSVSVINTEDFNAAAPLRLWNAVASGDEMEVKQVMATLNPDPNSTLAGMDTTPYEEAHHRGHTPVLRVLEEAMEKRPDTPHNDMVISVLQAHTKKVDAVFEAASGGQYRHTAGVDVLLRAYSLPGTVHDHQGRSLLHYAASVQLADGGPLWLAQDVRSLVESHGVLVNAVDFKGCNALHLLMEHAKNNEEITCWDGKTLSVCEAWLGLASLLMEVGCDPRLLDHRYRPPHQLPIAEQKPRLASLLSKAAASLGTPKSSPSLDKFPEMVHASARGDEDAVRRLLVSGVRVLPLGGHRDPLLEAVRGGHRNTVFLLLAAGAPLCAYGLLGNTPFDAAHRTLGLPGLFPALIRKEFCDRLQEELEELSASDKEHTGTVEGLIQLKSIAEVSGHRLGDQLNSWRDRRSSISFPNPTDTLNLAASLGLTLTCQLLGVAGVPLHPLPHLPHPLVRALTRGYYHTAYSLCRDLKMNPFSAGAAANTVPEQLVADLQEGELKRFEKKLLKKGTGATVANDLLQRVRGDNNSHTLKQLQTVLYLLAELNLVTLLHRMRQRLPDLDFNIRVHTASASTMLHVSAAYGKTTMAEYLLSRGADQKRLTRGGLVPSHLAALRGHTECVEYLVGCSRAEPQGSWGLNPAQCLQYFNENASSRHLDILTEQEATAIMGAKGELTKAQLILTGRCSKLGITSPGALWRMLEDEENKVKAYASNELDESILCDIKELSRQIGEIDERFCGEVVSFPSVKRRLDLFLPDNLEFYIDLDKYSALEGGCITMLNGNNSPRGFVAGITSTKNHELFNGENFTNTFRRVVQEALTATTFTTLILVPPFLGHTPGGVCLHAALKYPSTVVLVKVTVTPVIKATVPQWASLDGRTVNPGTIAQEYLAAGTGSHWVFLLNHLVEWVVTQGEEHEWRVLQACLFFIKLLETCWWLPKKETRDCGVACQTLPVGVAVPPTSTLHLHFMEELLGERRDAWTKEYWLNRLMGVARRASLPLGVESPIATLRPTAAMQATLQFLTGLQATNGQAAVT